MHHIYRLVAFTMLLALAGLGLAKQAIPVTPIAIIVPKGHVGVLNLADVALIFRRKKLFWNDGERVIPVNLQASTPLRQNFSRVILGSSPEEMEKYWNDMYFHGISPPYVLSSEEAVLRFVVQTPGAIGYVSYCDADSRVKVALVLTASGPVSEASAKATCPK